MKLEIEIPDDVPSKFNMEPAKFKAWLKKYFETMFKNTDQLLMLFKAGLGDKARDYVIGESKRIREEETE